MAKMKCQTRCQEEWKSFGTMNVCGQNGFWKKVIYFRKASSITLKKNLFPENDGTPLGLKALLFNRYDHWNGFMGGSRDKYAQGFKE